jgi:hypothetical protein
MNAFYFIIVHTSRIIAHTPRQEPVSKKKGKKEKEIDRRIDRSLK